MKIDPAALPTILSHVSAVQARLSRTLAGISDVSSSDSKPPLLLAGAELEVIARENVREALGALCTGRLGLIRDVGDARALIEWTATTVNRGLVPAGRPLYRTWKTPFPGQVAPEEIGGAMEEFLQRFCAGVTELASSTADAVPLAAWVERRLNWEIHPFSDGCGRCALVLAAALLACRGALYPVFQSRAEYLDAVGTGSLNEWVAEYRRRIPRDFAACE